MGTIYLFDVDGTLTPARQPMTENFRQFFEVFCGKQTVYLVTGSDRPKLDEQLPSSVRALTKGIFTCAGSQFWQRELLVYENHHAFDPELVKALENFIDESRFQGRFGNHLEHRTGMINISVPGRNVSQEGRKHYYKWDAEHTERAQFIEELGRLFPNYSAAAGGQISIDVSPLGWTKAQVLKSLTNWHPNASFTFFGDRMNDNGNDRPLADALHAHSARNESVAVNGPEDTQRLLTTMAENA